MTKFLTAFLFMVFSVETFASPVEALNKTMDEYNLFVTVEWDQKDKNLYSQRMTQLRDDVQEILITEKISKTDLENFLRSKVKSKASLDALLLKLRLANVNSPEAIVNILSESSSDLYSRGANWNPADGALLLMGGLVAVGGIGVILYFLVKTATLFARGSCKEYSNETVEVCGYNYNCHTVPSSEGMSLSREVCDDYGCSQEQGCNKY